MGAVWGGVVCGVPSMQRVEAAGITATIRTVVSCVVSIDAERVSAGFTVIIRRCVLVGRVGLLCSIRRTLLAGGAKDSAAVEHGCGVMCGVCCVTRAKSKQDLFTVRIRRSLCVFYPAHARTHRRCYEYLFTARLPTCGPPHDDTHET